MRFMILGKATAVSEAGVLLDAEIEVRQLCQLEDREPGVWVDCFRETTSAHHMNLGAGGAA